MNFDYVRPETINQHAVACRDDNVDMLKMLVDRCPEGLNSRDNRGWQPLHEAAHAGALQALRYLCSLASVDLNSRTWEGETPLFLACKNLPQSKEIVHALLKLHVRVNLGTNEDCTPLQYAAVKGAQDVVSWLVRKGADVNRANVWLETPLHCALKRSNVEEEQRLSIVKYLIKHGAKISTPDENLLTPLMLAAQKGLESVCKYLLSKDENTVNQRAEDGATALMLACQRGEVGVVELLLAAGAETNIRADDGTMAVHLATIAKKNCVALLERVLPSTSTDLIYQMNIGAKTEGGSINMSEAPKCLSPFHLAIDWENYEGVGLLVKYLDPTQFHVPIDECSCPVHSEFCYNFQKGRCELFPYRQKNPLSHLLSLANLPGKEESLRLLKFLETNILDAASLPPLLSLLIGSRRVDGNLFQEEDLHRIILRFLVEKGALLQEVDIFPLVLLSHVSGLWAALQEGLVNPRGLLDPDILDKIRHLINQGFSRHLLNTQFSSPMLSPRLLAVAHLVSECGLLNYSQLRNLHDILWDQLTELQIPKVEILNALYRGLRSARSLQSLCRASIYLNISGAPLQSLPRLGRLPRQIHQYLLFSDVDVCVLVDSYKQTWETVNSSLVII